MPPAKQKTFATEADLCAAFLDRVNKDHKDWTAYAETAGWDILLVRKEDSFQVGIEAKLRLNIEVINQAIEEYSYISVDGAGPDCRAVLVPYPGAFSFERIAAYIGLTIIKVDVGYFRNGPRFEPMLPKLNERHYSKEYWHEWAPVKRHELPEYIPDVRAGSPSPIQLTEWKIGALKLQALLEKNGHVTRSDFRTAGIDHRRWLARGSRWLIGGDLPGKYIKGPYFPNFAAQHPIVFEQVKADMAAIEAKAREPVPGMLL